MPFQIGQDAVDEDSIPSSEESDCSNGASNDGAVDISDDIIGNDDSKSGKENVGNHSPRKRPPSDDERLHHDDKTKKKSRKSRSHANKTKSSNDGNEATTPRSNPYPSTCTPTVTPVPKVSGEWSKDPLTMDEITKKICLDDDYRKAVTVVMDYDGDNDTLVSLKEEGYDDALQMHNNFVAQGCTSPPVRAGAVKHHQSMGSKIDATGAKSNMPDLATNQHRAMGSMYYATEKERGYKHPDENLSHNRLDYDSQCPRLAATAIPNMAKYHTTGHYSKPERNHHILLLDKICVCLVKGDGTKKHLDEQCRKLLDDLGVLTFFVENGVSLHAAMVAFIVPSIIFNVCQIYYNTKESVPMIAFGNPAAEIWRNGGFFATEYCHGHGKAIHPDQLVDVKKKTTLQACANSDACTTEWLKPLLRKDLECLNISVDKLRCFIAHKLMFGGMNDEEMRQVEESLPCYILHQMKLAVDKVKSKYSKDTPRWKMAMDLLDIDTEGTKIKRSWVELYVKHSKSIRESALPVVSAAVKEVESNFDDDTPIEVIVDSLKDIDPEMKKIYLNYRKSIRESAIPVVAAAIKKSVADGDERPREEIVESLEGVDPEMKKIYLNYRKSQKKGLEESARVVVSAAVKEARANFDDDTPIEVIVDSLKDIDPEMKKIYLKHSKSIRESAIPVVAAAIKKSVADGDERPREEIVESLEGVDPEMKKIYLNYRKSQKKGLEESARVVVSAAVKEARANFDDDTPIEEIVASLEDIDPEMKKIYLNYRKSMRRETSAHDRAQRMLPQHVQNPVVKLQADILSRIMLEEGVVRRKRENQVGAFYQATLPPGWIQQDRDNIEGSGMASLEMPQQNGWPVQPLPPGYPIGMGSMLSGPMPMMMMPQKPVQPFPPIQLRNDWQQQYILEQMDSRPHNRKRLPEMY